MESTDLEAGTIEDCVAACAECSRVCQGHVRHCLELGGEHAEPEHITMLLTCARVCDTAAALMALGSEWHPTFCDLCAQVCDECADACEDMDEMEDCVAACRACAEACRAMVDESDDEEEDEEDEDEEQGQSGREPVRAAH